MMVRICFSISVEELKLNTQNYVLNTVEATVGIVVIPASFYSDCCDKLWLQMMIIISLL